MSVEWVQSRQSQKKEIRSDRRQISGCLGNGEMGSDRLMGIRLLFGVMRNFWN